jgi:3-deoxy-7-phosphoheptulonate synthase
MQDEEVVRVLDVVNPDKEPGRVTLITRYGASKIEKHLAGHIAAVKNSGHPVVWICDPMHGNTQTSTSGLKTRDFNNIISELTACLRIHTESGSRLGGVSLEFTGELNEEGFSVTECLGGSMELKEDELGLRYQSFCDPRLNFEQSLDIAFLMSNHFKNERKAARLDQSGSADHTPTGQEQGSGAVVDTSTMYEEFKRNQVGGGGR